MTRACSGRAAIVAALLLALAGCSGATDDQVVPSGGGAGNGAVLHDWDELYRSQLDDILGMARAEGYQGSLPEDVEFVRFVSTSEAPGVHAECLTAQGFESEHDWQGHWLVGEVPADQVDAYWEAWLRCWTQYPQHPRYSVPHSEEQMRVYFEYYRDQLIPCLTSAGFDAGELPSWESFRATYHTQARWDPYAADVAHRPMSSQEWQEINERCPQDPPDELLWGG